MTLVVIIWQKIKVLILVAWLPVSRLRFALRLKLFCLGYEASLRIYRHQMHLFHTNGDGSSVHTTLLLPSSVETPWHGGPATRRFPLSWFFRDVQEPSSQVNSLSSKLDICREVWIYVNIDNVPLTGESHSMGWGKAYLIFILLLKMVAANSGLPSSGMFINSVWFVSPHRV